MNNYQDRMLLEQLYQTQILSPVPHQESNEVLEESSVFSKLIEVDPEGNKLRMGPGSRGAVGPDAPSTRKQVAHLHTNPEIGLKHNAKVNEWTVLDAGVSDKNKLDVIGHLKAGDGALIVYHDGPKEKILIRQKYGDGPVAGMTFDTSIREIGVGANHSQLIWILHSDGRVERRARATSGPNRVLDPGARFARGGVPRANVSVDYIDPARRKTVYIIPSSDFLPTSQAASNPAPLLPYTAHPRYGYDAAQYHSVPKQLTVRDEIRKEIKGLDNEAITGVNVSDKAKSILVKDIDKVTDIVSRHDNAFAARMRRIQDPVTRLTRILTWIGQYAQPSIHQIARNTFNTATRDRSPIENALRAEFGEDVVTDAIVGNISRPVYRDADKVIEIFTQLDPSPGKTLSDQFSRFPKDRQVDEIFKWVLRGNYIQHKLKALLKKGSLDNAIALGIKPSDIALLSTAIYKYRDALLALTQDRGNIDSLLTVFVSSTGGTQPKVWKYQVSHNTIHGKLDTTADVQKFTREFFHWLLTKHIPKELAIKSPEEVLDDINFDELNI